MPYFVKRLELKVESPENILICRMLW